MLKKRADFRTPTTVYVIRIKVLLTSSQMTLPTSSSRFLLDVIVLTLETQCTLHILDALRHKGELFLWV